MEITWSDPGFLIFLGLLLGLVVMIIFLTLLGIQPGDDRAECLADVDCRQNQVCVAGDCYSGTGGPCQEDQDCVNRADVCVEGICTPVRNGLNQPCPCQAGYICEPATNLCKGLENVVCQVNTDCLEHLICRNGRCFEPPELD